jgi:DNA-directed RNA polymerase specialized sigma24 family protein
MAAPRPVTDWIELLKQGDSLAAQRLWEGYFRRLVELARKKLRGSRRREADEEDVALSAFHSLCRGAGQGRFPQLADRHDLWQLLVVITARKARDQIDREHRLKRGGGAVRGESALLGLAASPEAPAGLEQAVGHEPTPEFAAQMADECRRLLDKLGDDELRSIAVWKMEGYTNEQITERLELALATVERRLGVIRKLWSGESAS